MMNITDIMIHKLTERVKDLEEKVNNKSKRNVTTRSQQMLLLKHCGIIGLIIDLDIQKQQKAKLLSILLNADETNIEDDLSHILEDIPEKRSKKDIEFLLKTFDETGLKDKKKEIEAIYEKVLRK